nr:G164 [uncultured bacterium]
MEIRFDWPKIYDSVLFETMKREKFAQVVARDIEQAIEEDGTPAGGSLGTSPELCERFGVGKETLLEATRLLADRGVANMRRGAHGGLIVLGQRASDPAALLERYLSGVGISVDQILEAQRAIALVGVYGHHIRHGRAEDFNELFRQLVSDGRSPLGKPLPPGPWTAAEVFPCLKPFHTALDALLASKNMSKSDDHARCQGLVGLSADYLTGEVVRLRRIGVEKLGTELQIAERIGVSRQVLRQAMRLLEDQGLLACRRGRSNGIVTAAAHPANIVRSLSDFFASRKLVESDFRHVLSVLDRINRSLFAAKAEDSRFGTLQRMIEQKDWRKPATHIRRMHLEWPVLNNPALSLLEQSLSAYRARRAGPRVFVAIGDTDLLRRRMFEHVDLMRSRDLGGADRRYMEIHSQITVLLGGN